MRSTIPTDAFIINKKASSAIYQQLYRLIQQAINSGKFPAQSKLPSSRELSKQLCIARSTVTTVYDQLIAEGYLISKQGSATRVATALKILGHEKHQSLTPFSDLLPEQLSPLARSYLNKRRKYASYAQATFAISLPDKQNFPNVTWAKLLNKYAKKTLGIDAGYDHPTGVLDLKSALADYLSLARGVDTTVNNVLILNSTQAALDILCRLFLQPNDNTWIEDPGYNGIRTAITNCGAKIYPINVDSEGLKIPPQAPIPKLIYTTPSHQYPTGVIMSYKRRSALLDYAYQHKSWILEDDYDSEFRYSGKPLPSLQGLDQQQKVIYLGTFSKSISPSLRVAYMVVPDVLTDVVSAFMADIGQGVNLTVQHALAEFIHAGHYSLHIRKAKQQYANKQQLLITTLEKYLADDIILSQSNAGLQTTIYFKKHINDVKVAKIANQAGLSVRPLSSLYQQKQDSNKQGLVIGFAATEINNIQSAVIKLAAIIQQLKSS